jgi:hypothetical protein
MNVPVNSCMAVVNAQDAILHLHGRTSLTRASARPRLARWAFRHYLDIARPACAQPAPPATRRPAAVAAQLRR